MAVIDRVQLLADTKVYLPKSNKLTDAIISSIINLVVTTVVPADDSIYYNQALCETLYRCGIANLSMYSVDGASKKRQKVGNVEVENFEGSGKDIWKAYVDSLRDFCPLVLGVPFPVSVTGIFINSGDEIVISDCSCLDDLYL